MPPFNEEAERGNPAHANTRAAVPNEKERERVRSELEGRLTILKDAAKNLEDPGVDCALFAC